MSIASKYNAYTNWYSSKITDQSRQFNVEVGDSDKTNKLYPTIRLNHWDKKCYLSFELDKAKDCSISENDDTDTITIYNDEWGIEYYDVNGSGFDEESQYEYKIVLYTKPASNVLDFKVKSKDLTAFGQSGSGLPDNVQNSYALYYTKKNKEYKTGKALHLYRPYVTDSGAAQDWCTHLLDLQSNAYSITIPYDIWDNGVYPLYIDPTFGNTSIGSSTVSFAGNQFRLNLHTLSESATLQNLYMYAVGTNDYFKGLVYDDSSTYPVNQVDLGTATAVPNTAGWAASPLTASVSAADYWIGAITSSSITLYRDITGGTAIYYYPDSYTSPSDPFPGGGSSSAQLYSFYVEYTASGGTIYTPKIYSYGL